MPPRRSPAPEPTRIVDLATPFCASLLTSVREPDRCCVSAIGERRSAAYVEPGQVIPFTCLQRPVHALEARTFRRAATSSVGGNGGRGPASPVVGPDERVVGATGRPRRRGVAE